MASRACRQCNASSLLTFFAAQAWHERSLHSLDDLMTCEALRHGIFDDRAALPSLSATMQ